MKRRDLLKLPAALCAVSAEAPTRRGVVDADDRFEQARHRVEHRRTALEQATGHSTWDPPLAHFEHAVTEETLVGASVYFELNGLVLIDSYSDYSSFRSWDEILKDTLDLWNSSTHAEDLADERERRRVTAAALRAAAFAIEQPTGEARAAPGGRDAAQCWRSTG